MNKKYLVTTVAAASLLMLAQGINPSWAQRASSGGGSSGGGSSGGASSGGGSSGGGSSGGGRSTVGGGRATAQDTTAEKVAQRLNNADMALASYPTAPNALFHAGFLDMGKLHQRLGDVLAEGTSETQTSDSGEFFLRAHGANTEYRPHLGASQHGYAANQRYRALQAGVNLYGIENAERRVRFGIAASRGNLTFSPNDKDARNSLQAKLHLWSVGPIFTWQNAAGAYIDAIAAWGEFDGAVDSQTVNTNSTDRGGATSTRGPASASITPRSDTDTDSVDQHKGRLKGSRFAASLEAGIPMHVSENWHLVPQVQLMYQRLKFDRSHDADVPSVQLGSIAQWTLRAGGEIQRTLFPVGDGHVQVYGKLHIVHTMGGNVTVWLNNTDQLRTGKSGTFSEIGLGLDVTQLGGHTTSLYAELTRQQRIGRVGHQGWSANLGVRVRF